MAQNKTQKPKIKSARSLHRLFELQSISSCGNSNENLKFINFKDKIK